MPSAFTDGLFSADYEAAEIRISTSTSKSETKNASTVLWCRSSPLTGEVNSLSIKILMPSPGWEILLEDLQEVDREMEAQICCPHNSNPDLEVNGWMDSWNSLNRDDIERGEMFFFVFRSYFCSECNEAL